MPDMPKRRVPALAALLALVLAAAPLPGRGQEVPVLLADRVSFDPGAGILTAEGNVEVFHDGARLTVARAIYRDGAARVELAGPIRLTGPDGATAILADAGALSADLRDGLLTGARMLLEQELQLAAARVERIGGRYTRLSNTVATACRICPGGGPPVWEIRADEVLHDQTERQLHFRNAQVRALGVPIAWLPRLRLPDPTVERMTGFLVPRFHSSGTLGFGVRQPYFRTLGPHADLLLTPWVTSTDSHTLEYRYRRAFAAGTVEVAGAVSRDSLTDDPWRAFVFARGAFALPRDWRLRFDVELVSDPGYLLDYDYSDKDRLDSALAVERVRPDRFAAAGLIGFQSLRDDSDAAPSPVVVGDAIWIWRFAPAAIGGRAELGAGIEGWVSDHTGAESAGDMLQLTGRADWRRDWRLVGGMRAGLIARLDGDLFLTGADGGDGDAVPRLSPRVAAEWRWPLYRRGTHAQHLLQPVAQLVWAGKTGGEVANADSVLVEFDETNLFALSRFPGRDRTETGVFANLGVEYLRRGSAGLPLRLAIGRVLRATDRDQFGEATGLDGAVSDWVTAAHATLSDRSTLAGRAVFDDSLTLSKAEFRVDLAVDRFDLATTYLWVESDADEDMAADISEWALDAGVRLSPYWRAEAGWRYDAVDGEPTRARLGLIYANECIAVELSARRRFTESRGAEATTDISLELSFDGFGDRGPRPPPRSCRGRV
jgi:LPS-assembly protein